MASLKNVLRDNVKANKRGEHRIGIRLIHQRKVRHVYHYPVTISPKDWSKKTESVRSTHPLAGKINEELKIRLQETQLIIDEALLDNDHATIEQLSEKIEDHFNGGGIDTDFIKYARNYIDGLYSEKRVRYANKMLYTIDKLNKYCNGQLPFRNLYSSKGGVPFMKQYRRYLAVELGNGKNTIYGNFKNMKTIMKSAIADGYMPQNENPFFIFSVEREETNKAHLTVSQIHAMEQIDLPIGSVIDRTRDCFLFSFYCAGIRFSDMIQLTWRNIKDRDGVPVLDYEMGKTKGTSGSRRILPLSDPALRILNKYRPERPVMYGYIFPWLDEELYPSAQSHKYSPAELKRLVKACSSATTLSNKYLKQIAKTIGIRENVTNHIARHTFTSIGEEVGLSVEELQKLLGHSSTAITEVYRSNFTANRDALAMNKFFDQFSRLKKEATTGE